MVTTENTVCPIKIAVTQVQTIIETVLEIQGIEGLFILPPAYVAEKTLIIENNSLPPDAKFIFIGWPVL